MELLEGIETRKSIRAFESTPIPAETIRKILKAASLSPTYKNTQPWEVVVLTGKKKEELSEILLDLAKSRATPNPDITHPQSLPPDLDKRSREHGMRRLVALGIEREDKESRLAFDLTNYDFYGAPCGLLLFMNGTSSGWSIFDMGIFAQSIILAAHSFGIGGCIQAMVTNYPDAVREFLGLPGTKQLVGGIALGYPDPKAGINAYKALKVGIDEFVHWYT